VTKMGTIRAARSAATRARVFALKVFIMSTTDRLPSQDATMPRVTPHDLRHTAASLAISAGPNVKAVQRMLGHKSAAMTLDTYSDLFDDDLDAVGAALDQARTASSVGKVWARAVAGDSATPLLPRDSRAGSA
jgi:integrase